MRRNILNKLTLLLCLLTVVACKSKKHMLAERKPDTTVVATDSATKVITKTGTTVVAAPVDNLKLEKLNAIRLKQVDFSTFSGKAATKLSLDGDTHDVTLNIRIKKNQQIWVSITAVLGVEVARALITPDSIKLMNKLESTYLKKPFSFIYTYTSKKINYKTLESLLIGNAVPDLIGDSANLKPDNGNLVVNGNLQDLMYQLIIGPDLRVTQTNMSNQKAGQSLAVLNSVFVQAGTRVIPSKININSIAGSKEIKADLHYNKADFDVPVSMPFSVPARYTLAN